MSSTGIDGTFDRFRIFFDSDLLGKKLISDPINILEDVIELKRSKDLNGVFKTLSDSLEYIKNPQENSVSSYDYILTVYESEGVNGVVKIIKQTRNDITDVWEDSFSSFIDLSTIKYTKTKLKAQLTESQFYNDIKSKEDEEYELERVTDIFNNPIDEITPRRAFIEDRVVLVTALLETKDTDNETIISVSNTSGSDDKYKTAGVPMDEKFSGDGSIQSTFGNVDINDNQHTGSGTTNIMFYAVSDRDRTITIDISIFAKIQVISLNDTSNEQIRLRLTKYGNNENYNFISTEVLVSIDGVTNTSVVNEINYTGTRTIDLLKGESLSLQFHSGATVGGFLQDGRYDVRFFDILSRINYSERSVIEPSISDVYLPHEIGERLVQITTGKKNAFKSNIFGRTDLGYETDGEFAYLGVTSGAKIREIPDSKVPISFKDFFDSYNTITPLAMFIEKVNGREIVRIEAITEAFNGRKIINLGTASKLETTIDSKRYFSKIEIGYPEAGNYEEQQGLDEPNVINSYSFPIRNSDKTLELKSKIRADSFAIAVARRKSFKKKPNEDTRYDDSLFFLDLKTQENSNLLVMRKWDDDFLSVPEGVFSPETAQNLRLSPMNCLYRHGYLMRAIGFKNQSDFIVFSSTIGNSNLVTQLKNGTILRENGNIKISDLPANFFIPEEVSFETSLSTKQRNDMIKNPHSLFSYIDEQGLTKYGWLISVTPKKLTKFVLLKAPI